MAREFAKLHPDIQLQVRKVGFSSLNDEAMRAVMSGNGPDVIPIDNPNTAMFAAKNALLDLTPYLAKSKVIDVKQIYPGPLKKTPAGTARSTPSRAAPTRWRCITTKTCSKPLASTPTSRRKAGTSCMPTPKKADQCAEECVRPGVLGRGR